MQVQSISDLREGQVKRAFASAKSKTKAQLHVELQSIEAAIIDDAWQEVRARHLVIGNDPERSNDPDFVLTYPRDDDDPAWEFIETAPWSRDEITICPDLRRRLYAEAQGKEWRQKHPQPEGLDATAAAILEHQSSLPASARDFDPSTETHIARLAACIFGMWWEALEPGQDREEERALYADTIEAAKAAHGAASAFDGALAKASAAAKSYAAHRNIPTRRDGRDTSYTLNAAQAWTHRVQPDPWRLVIDPGSCAAHFQYRRSPWRVAPDALTAAKAAIALAPAEAKRLAEFASLRDARDNYERDFATFKKKHAKWTETKKGDEPTAPPFVADPGEAQPSAEFVDAIAATYPDGAALRFFVVHFMGDEVGADVLPHLIIGAMVRRYSQIVSSGMVYDARTQTLLSETRAIADAQELWGPDVERGVIERQLRARCPKFQTTCYMPAANPEPIVSTRAGLALNLAKPFPARPRRGDVSVFTEHLRYLIPDEHERRTFLQWLAFAVRNPDARLNWAPILITPAQGTGKDSIIIALENVVGRANLNRPSLRDIREGRGTWLQGGYLCCINETFLGREATESLKVAITEPTLSIRPMYGEPMQFEHRTKFLFLSNSDAALAIDARARRFFVIKSEVEPRDAAYYKRLHEWIEADQGEGLAHFLLHEVDLTGFDPYRAPVTDAHRDMARTSAGSDAALLRHRIESRSGLNFKGDLISVGRLQAALAQESEAHERLRVSPNLIVQVLRECGAVLLERVEYVETDFWTRETKKVHRGNLWCIANADHWLTDRGEGIAKRRGEAVFYGKTWHDISKESLAVVVSNDAPAPPSSVQRKRKF